MSTPTSRQLPGFNRQWIKTSECPPTEADLDEKGDLEVRQHDGWCRVTSLRKASGYELWKPAAAVDPRPFTLEPVITQPATTPRQLPGVKGQWILCSDCPPTAADADRDGEVRVYSAYHPFMRYEELDGVKPTEYWCPHSEVFDPRPFALEPATAPPAPTERRIVQLVCHPNGTAIYGVADDGTAWVSTKTIIPAWVELASLPPREA